MTQQTVTTVTCDGEGCSHVQDGDGNWLVGVVTQHVQQNTMPRIIGKSLYVAANRELLPIGLEQDPNVKDFCGEECTIKWVSKMLAEIKK